METHIDEENANTVNGGYDDHINVGLHTLARIIARVHLQKHHSNAKKETQNNAKHDAGEQNQ